MVCLALGGRKLSKHLPLLMPALAGLSVAATGVMFLLLKAESPDIPMFFLRTGLAVGATRIFAIVMERRDPVMDWLASGLGVLPYRR